MKIKVGLTEKSIDAAIKAVEEYQKRAKEFLPAVIAKSAEAIIELANERLDGTTIGQNVINSIKTGWLPLKKLDDEHYILENGSDKAVFVEFGVGEVGSISSHDIADKVGYEYDMNAHGEEGWTFYVNSQADVDIAKESYVYGHARDIEVGRKKKRDRLYIRTSGSPATMFLYQAAMDFCDKGMIAPIAKQVMKELGL